MTVIDLPSKLQELFGAAVFHMMDRAEREGREYMTFPYCYAAHRHGHLV